MLKTKTVTLTVTTGGTTGTATTDAPVIGTLKAVYVKYAASTAATTDLTIKTVGDAVLPSLTFLTITDSSTDAWYYPTVSACDSAGAAVTYDGTRVIKVLPVLADYVNIAAAQSTSAKTISVTLFYDGGC